ncbi:MAG: hypothetical protein LBG19_03225 [Prevotellaceae bacterium]|jgi:hypothetical protein|nr:hypothetical protein [Prevotellaceae bacterium]
MALFIPIAMGVAAAGSAIGNIIGNRKRKKELKRQQELADAERSNNQAMYEKDYYTPYTETTEAKAALETAREHLAEEGKKSAQAAAISGGSNERSIAQKEASNKSFTNLVRSIAGQGQSFKNAVRGQYLTGKAANNQTQASISNARAGLAKDSAESWNNLFESVMSLGMGLSGGTGMGKA